MVARETTTRTVVLSGKVGRSLNRSARKAGLTAANINSMTDEIFKYDIDFNSDLDADDRFSVVVEQTWREGELISTSPVQAATFTVDGKLYSGFRYARAGEKPEYFTAQGRPLKKTFIRMPIPYARLSFALRRAQAPDPGQDAHAQGRGLRRFHRHADHGRGRFAGAVRGPAERLRQRGDPRPRPRLHHPVRAHVALRQDQGRASASPRAR